MLISKIISTDYRKTIYDCFAMSMQIYAKAEIDYAPYPNDEERFLSFLFNLLEKSIEIRKSTEDLIIYSENSDWINYAKAAGALL